jgi:hypothetical protein
MASIAIMIGGAILNATAFIGGSSLAKVLGGQSESERIAEQKRHDLALEKYQSDVAAWQKEQKQYRNWLDENYRNKMIADKNFEDTDYAFKLYSQTHPNISLRSKPVFNYTPSKKQKNSELIYLGVGGLVLGGVAAALI